MATESRCTHPVTDVEIPVTCLRAALGERVLRPSYRQGKVLNKALCLNTANFRGKCLGKTNARNLLVKCLVRVAASSACPNSRTGFRYRPRRPYPCTGHVSHTPRTASRK